VFQSGSRIPQTDTAATLRRALLLHNAVSVPHLNLQIVPLLPGEYLDAVLPFAFAYAVMDRILNQRLQNQWRH
jgi:hypothetical protein